MNTLIGRKKELKKLQGYLTSYKSEFVAIYGRRRVGKTFLIRKAFKNQFVFQLTGLANASRKQQLIEFYESLKKYAKPLNEQPQLQSPEKKLFFWMNYLG